VTLDQEGKNALSIDIYQYLDNTTYGNKSVPNPNMIVSGAYKVLEAKEIGICTATAKRYNLKVGSTIYVQNKQSTVKFIFEDVSSIKNIDFKSLKKTIFVGKGTITDVPQLYANFSPDLEATGHLSQYTFDISDIRKDIRGKFFNSTIEITALIGVFNLLIGLIFAIPLWFYSSNEQKRTGYKSTRSLIVFSLLDSLTSIIFISVPALFFKPFIIFLICLCIGVVLAILKNTIQIIVLERSVVHGK